MAFALHACPSQVDASKTKLKGASSLIALGGGIDIDPEPFSTEFLGSAGLCVIGCTPYVDLNREDTGLAKYRALIAEMAQTCDILVHLGDTKSGVLVSRQHFR